MIGLQLPGINNSETVAMKPDPPFYTPLPAADMNRDVGVPSRSRKRARGDDDDIVASCVFASNSRANGINGTEVNGEIAHLQQKLEEKDLELNRIKYKLTVSQGEIKTIEAMSEARQSSYERALKELEIRESEKTEERDADFQKMKTDLDTLVQEKDDLLVLLKGRQKALNKALKEIVKRDHDIEVISYNRDALQRERAALNYEKVALQADLEAELKEARDKLQSMESKLDTMSHEQDALNMKLEDQLNITNSLVADLKAELASMKVNHITSSHCSVALQTVLNITNSLVADLKAELASMKTVHESLLRIIEVKDAELKENKLKLDATESSRVELSAKLELGAASLSELEANLKVTNSELQEVLEATDSEKNALVAGFNAELESMRLNLKAANENLLKMTLERDAELQENQLKLDEVQALRVELSNKLDAEAVSSAHIRYELEQAEAAANQASEAKDSLIQDLTSELSQIKKDLYDIQLHKDAFERQALTEVSSKDNIIHQLCNELSAMQTNFSTYMQTNSAIASSLSAKLQGRENEVRELKDELHKVRQDKASVEDILSAARVSTTKYKAKVESELINARTRLEVVEAEKIMLTAKLDMLTITYTLNVSEVSKIIILLAAICSECIAILSIVIALQPYVEVPFIIIFLLAVICYFRSPFISF